VYREFIVVGATGSTAHLEVSRVKFTRDLTTKLHTRDALDQR
jgi:hypothetical protein